MQTQTARLCLFAEGSHLVLVDSVVVYFNLLVFFCLDLDRLDILERVVRWGGFGLFSCYLYFSWAAFLTCYFATLGFRTEGTRSPFPKSPSCYCSFLLLISSISLVLYFSGCLLLVPRVLFVVLPTYGLFFQCGVLTKS